MYLFAYNRNSSICFRNAESLKEGITISFMACKMSLLKHRGLEQSREKVIETKLKQEFVPGRLKTRYFKVYSDSLLIILFCVHLISLLLPMLTTHS